MGSPYVYMRVGNFGGCNIDRQTAKFNSPPNFPAIRYLSYAMLHNSQMLLSSIT